MHDSCAAGALLSVILSGWACDSSSTGPSSVASGLWGGNHVTMVVAQAATHLEFDCAHGDIQGAIPVDTRSRFDVMGTFGREHGGPIRQDEVPDSHPATYSGSISSTTMTLTIQLNETKETIGTFTLTRDSPGRVVK